MGPAAVRSNERASEFDEPSETFAVMRIRARDRRLVRHLGQRLRELKGAGADPVFVLGDGEAAVETAWKRKPDRARSGP